MVMEFRSASQTSIGRQASRPWLFALDYPDCGYVLTFMDAHDVMLLALREAPIHMGGFSMRSHRTASLAACLVLISSCFRDHSLSIYSEHSDPIS